MQKILGVRTSPSAIRYAILCKNDDGTLQFLNFDSENKLDFPADLTTINEKIAWFGRELSRILHIHQDIEKIAVKSSEYGRGAEKTAMREAAYLDGTVILIASQKTIPLPVSVKVYKGIKRGVNRTTVKEFAQSNVGSTTKYWNEQMADAVAVAFSELE